MGPSGGSRDGQNAARTGRSVSVQTGWLKLPILEARK
jgi:hypothetical protein